MVLSDWQISLIIYVLLYGSVVVQIVMRVRGASQAWTYKAECDPSHFDMNSFLICHNNKTSHGYQRALTASIIRIGSLEDCMAAVKELSLFGLARLGYGTGR